MRTTHLQYTLILLTVILAVAFTTVACNAVSEQNRDRLGDLAERGQALAGTVASNAPSYAATAQSAASTAIAAAPTIAVNAQSAAATASANAQAVATIASAQGDELLIMADRLRTRVASLQPDANGNIVVSISEAELTGALTRDEVSESGRLENLAASLDDGKILLTGNMVRPVSAPFAVVFLPYVEDGLLKLVIEEATIGRIQVPSSLTNRVENRLNKTLSQITGLIPANVTITAVSASQGFLTITATQ